jgi:hypothetical protein
MCLISLIASVRTNIVFVTMSVSLTMTFDSLSGAVGTTSGLKLLEGDGGCAFVTCCTGWHILWSLILASTKLPGAIPCESTAMMITISWTASGTRHSIFRRVSGSISPRGRGIHCRTARYNTIYTWWPDAVASGGSFD